MFLLFDCDDLPNCLKHPKIQLFQCTLDGHLGPPLNTAQQQNIYSITPHKMVHFTGFKSLAAPHPQKIYSKEFCRIPSHQITDADHMNSCQTSIATWLYLPVSNFATEHGKWKLLKVLNHGLKISLIHNGVRSFQNRWYRLCESYRS